MPISLSWRSLELESMRTVGSSWPHVNPVCPWTLPWTHFSYSSWLVCTLGWKHYCILPDHPDGVWPSHHPSLGNKIQAYEKLNESFSVYSEAGAPLHVCWVLCWPLQPSVRVLTTSTYHWLFSCSRYFILFLAWTWAGVVYCTYLNSVYVYIEVSN